MKKFSATLCLIGLGMAKELKLSFEQVKNQSSMPGVSSNSYRISCSGASGNVKYSGFGLPQGITLSSSTIYVSDSTKPGNYNIVVRAVDDYGATVDTNLTLRVGSNKINVGSISSLVGSKTQVGPVNAVKSNSNGNVGMVDGQSQNLVGSRTTGTVLNSPVAVNYQEAGSIANNARINVSGSTSSQNTPQVIKISAQIPLIQNSQTQIPLIQNSQIKNPSPQTQSETQTYQSFTSQNQIVHSQTSQTRQSQITQGNQNIKAQIQTTQNDQLGQSLTINQAENSGFLSKIGDNIAIGVNNNNVSNLGPNGLSTSSDKLNSLLTSYSDTTSINTIKNYGYNGKYPEITMPTGSTNANTQNPTLINIQQRKSTPSDANRNTITADDVAMKAASERYQNAIKGITNLLTIIDQARANKSKAQTDIQVYTQAYNETVSAQKNAQSNIISIETRTSQIVSAINSISFNIKDYQNQINGIVLSNDAFKQSKISIMSTFNDFQNKKAVLLQNLNGLNSEVATTVKNLSDKTAQQQNLQNYIDSKTKNIADLQMKMNGIEKETTVANNDIATKTKTVDDLRAQLAAAQKALADSKVRLTSLESLKQTLPVAIDSQKNQLLDFQSRSKTCVSQISTLQQTINQLKGSKYSTITKNISDYDIQIGISRTKVSTIDIQIAASQAPLQSLKANLVQAFSDLQFIKEKKITYDQNLRVAYQNGNDINNKVAIAKKNLDDITKRYLDESKVVSDATMNLQKARAEQSLARIGLDQLIARYSDALPYSIVPNGGGVGIGSPAGNNPSGSALGTVNINGQGAVGSFKINSWNNYLSSAYGAGVNPAFPGSVTELFPFSFFSTVKGNTIVNQQTSSAIASGSSSNLNINGSGSSSSITTGCFESLTSNTQKSLYGTVIAVRPDGFDLRDDENKIYKVIVANCTKLTSNLANYSMREGDTAVIKGSSRSLIQNSFNAYQGTCLQK